MAKKQQETTGAEGDEKKTITIKKYANRRLYNTETSSYVTLDNLAQMVKDGKEFAVFDAKTGEDITRQVLTHIIVEEESKGQNLLPISFLRHLISFYGDSLQAVVPNYLDHSMSSFARNQEQMRHYLEDAFDLHGRQYRSTTRRRQLRIGSRRGQDRTIQTSNPFRTGHLRYVVPV